MRVVIEKFYDDNEVEIGELVIESDALGYQVVHYSANFTKVKGIEMDKKGVISMANYLT